MTILLYYGTQLATFSATTTRWIVKPKEPKAGPCRMCDANTKYQGQTLLGKMPKQVSVF